MKRIMSLKIMNQSILLIFSDLYPQYAINEYPGIENISIKFVQHFYFYKTIYYLLNLSDTLFHSFSIFGLFALITLKYNIYFICN